jgi:hypothetical protein
MSCDKCGKPLGTPIQVAFDKFPGPLQPGKDFGICACLANNSRRERVRERERIYGPIV